jgi:hypothetical protein
MVRLDKELDDTEAKSEELANAKGIPASELARRVLLEFGYGVSRAVDRKLEQTAPLRLVSTGVHSPISGGSRHLKVPSAARFLLRCLELSNGPPFH